MDPRDPLRAAAALLLCAFCPQFGWTQDIGEASVSTPSEVPGIVRLAAAQPGFAQVIIPDDTTATSPAERDQPGTEEFTDPELLAADELEPLASPHGTIEVLPGLPPEPAPPIEVLPLPVAQAPACLCDPWARLRRAGHPQRIAPWARFTYGPKYCGYYVGGGAALYGRPDLLHGEPRYPHEGTFGMDYAPSYSRVVLNWFHGTRYQAGEGQYEPDHHNNPFEHFFGR